MRPIPAYRLRLAPDPDRREDRLLGWVPFGERVFDLGRDLGVDLAGHPPIAECDDAPRRLLKKAV